MTTSTERTNAELLPMRTVRIVWEDDVESQCTWCGQPLHDMWVIEADPIPERFCTPQCAAHDTIVCWSPAEDC